MSQENVELARQGVEAFAAGDWETLMAVFAPDVEWEEMPSLGPDASVYRGIEGVRDAVGSWARTWTDYTFEAREYIDAGDDDVVLVHESGRGRSTGANVEREFGQILTFREEKLVRNRLYGSWAEALKAAGLSE